jgi:hypothetical protein
MAVLRMTLLGTTAALILAGWATPSQADLFKEIGKGVKNVVKTVEKAGQDVGKTAEKAGQDIGKTAEKAGQDIGKTAEKAGQDVGKTAEKAGQDIGKTAEKAGQDAGKTAEKALHDIGKTGEKAGQDAGKTIEKAVHDSGDAVVAVVDFTGHTWDATRVSVGNAYKRIREGKIVDAIWHLSTDPLKDGEANAFKMAQQSNVIRVAGQIAASAYGGPGGAAAYAAWLTYKQTGSLDAALKVGVIAGVTSLAMGQVGELPHDTASEMTKQVILSGAVGGLAVAASGGDEAAIKDAFFKGAAFTVVRNVYEDQVFTKLDARSSRGEAYCMGAVDTGVACAPPRYAYDRVDGDGMAQVNPDTGLPQVDVRMTDPGRPHVGTWSSDSSSPWVGTGERSLSMTAVSKYPGMNAMAMLHDHVSYEMNLDPVSNVVTIVPATVFTYYGTETPLQEAIRKADQDQRRVRAEQAQTAEKPLDKQKAVTN